MRRRTTRTPACSTHISRSPLLSAAVRATTLPPPPFSSFLSRARSLFAETPRETLERTFKSLLARDDVGLLLINQPIADQIRPVVNAHKAIIPMILEIPSKDVAYDPAKDPLMKRVLQMLGEEA